MMISALQILTTKHPYRQSKATCEDDERYHGVRGYILAGDKTEFQAETASEDEEGERDSDERGV
jgi:hypothetical protein